MICLIINLAPPATDNTTDDILVLSANGDVSKTSKAGITSALDLEKVTDNGNNTTNDINVYSSNNESIVHSRNHLTYSKITSGVERKTKIDFDPPTESTVTLTIPAKSADDTFAMLSDIGGGTVDLQTVLTNGGEAYGIEGDILIQQIQDDDSVQIEATGGNFSVQASGSFNLNGAGAGSSSLSSGGGIKISSETFGATVKTTNLTADHDIEFPDESGTIALVENITLQSVIDNDGVTTSSPTIKGVPLYVQNAAVSAYGFIEQGDSYLDIRSNKPIRLNSDGNHGVELGVSGGVSIPFIHGSYNNTLPNATGYLAVSVNGNTADSSGNITISTGGATNLSYTASPTNGIVASDTGTDATIPLADTTNAGLLAPADKTKLNNTTGTNSGDNATNTTSNTYADGKVSNDLTASTTVAPSKTAVNNALSTKQDAFGSSTGYPYQSGGSTSWVTGTANNVLLANGNTITRSTLVLNQAITGYTSGAGTVAATDSVLQAIQKLNGNDALKADLVGANDIEITNATKGLILKDAGDGTRRRITVVNGVLTVSAPL